MKKQLFILALLAGSTLFAGAEVFKLTNAKEFGTSRVTPVAGGGFSFERTGSFGSSKPIVFDTKKKYKFSAEVRSAPGTDTGMMFYLGFEIYGKNKKRIASEWVNPVPNTATVLAADAKVGDKILKIKDGKKWLNYLSTSYIAFDAKDDYSDLPNSDLGIVVKNSIKKEGDIWVLSLRTPMKKARKAGTKVRQQRGAGTYFYAVIKKLTPQWQKVESKVIDGIAVQGASTTKLWPGSHSAKVLIMTLGNGKNVKSQVRNFTITEVK